jgi:ankyrin repeat protein
MRIFKVSLLFLVVSAVFAQNPADHAYLSVRNNDLGALRTLTKDQGLNQKEAGDQTPLMFAAAFGSLDAMKLMLANGADAKAVSAAGVTALHWAAGDARKVRLLLEYGPDVNKASLLGRTPLLVAAGTTGAIETVKLLVDKGADVNAADSNGLTPIVAAAGVNNIAVVKLLVEKGANINARATAGATVTALMGAAANGNAELTRFLLAHNADVHAISPDNAGNVKNGPVAFGKVTALHFAVDSGDLDTVRLLLDAGGAVNAQDVRGLTSLVFAVATDRPNIEIVRLLLARGADRSIPSYIKETPIDWARKFNNSTVLAAMKIEPAGKTAPAQKITSTAILTPQRAVERSLPLLQRSAANVFTAGGCVACHAQPVSKMAASMVQSRGWRIDDEVLKSAAAESARVVGSLNANVQGMLQGREGGGQPDTQLYDAMMMITSAEPASQGTDALVHYLAAKQRPEGYWQGIGASRAPIQDGNLSRTAMAIRVLSTYGVPGRKAEWIERIGRAADWLAKQTPQSTEDRVMQLLGLKWAGAQASLREKRTLELLAIQQPDGGWAQTPYLTSDAYATGQALYTLHESGIPSSDPAFRRGAGFLVSTQKEDGSWYVKSRALKIQPYFQSGFPYEHDQWISSAGTAWAVMALTLTEAETSAAPAAARNFK